MGLFGLSGTSLGQGLLGPFGTLTSGSFTPSPAFLSFRRFRTLSMSSPPFFKISHHEVFFFGVSGAGVGLSGVCDGG